ncbi:MAG: hypothetical protein JRG84_19575 [Deltaproteobacteria bacterium]|nr:hypothetical protein [Deltaproteobacteria bacterium]
MVELDISPADVTALRETLESALSDLGYEIHNTDSHDYREKLRSKQRSLERVVALLAGG